MSGVIDCLKSIVEINEKKNLIRPTEANTNILTFIKNATAEETPNKLFLNGRILALYSIYRILLKADVPEDSALKVTLTCYSAAMKNGIIGGNNDDTNVEFTKATTNDINNFLILKTILIYISY